VNGDLSQNLTLSGYQIDFGRNYISMVVVMPGEQNETEYLLEQAAGGDKESLGKLLTRHEDRLRRMIAFRLDHRLQGRIDTSDVIQEVWVEVAQHLSEYQKQGSLPFFLWLRGVAGNKLRELHRHHLGTQMRDVGREVALYHGTMPETSSAALAAQLLGHLTPPSQAAIRAEAKIRLQEALNSIDPLDREVLALRHFEQLTPTETAQVLGIKEKAAGMRYVRALRKLKEILSVLPGGPLEF
jgi:RNA polymerase sigma-70 factor (ECF subfamily)